MINAMMNFSASLLCLCAVLSFYPCLGWGESFKIGLMEREPFAWKKPELIKGFHYDIAQQISQRSGYTFEAQISPWLRTVSLLETKEVDVIIMIENRHLQDLKTKKAFLFDVDVSIYSKKEKGFQLDSKKMKRIARIPIGCKDLEGHKDIQWTIAKSYIQSYELLKMDRVQAVCGTSAFLYAMESLKAPTDNIQSTLIGHNTVSIHALPDIDPIKRNAIEKAAKSIVEDGTIDRLARKYTLEYRPCKRKHNGHR